jgi:Cu/Ag efflux protein CusF
MRKHVVLSLTLLLVLAVAAGAQTNSAKTSSSKTKTTTSTTTPSSTSTKPKYLRANGDITAIDASAQTFTIKHGKDSWTFKTDSSTKVKGLGKDIDFSSLKEGDNVRVSYTNNGTDKIASRIDVLHGKKSHA